MVNIGKLWNPNRDRLLLDPRAIGKAGLSPDLTPAELAGLHDLGILPGIMGGARGINSLGDVITQTADGISLNTLWADYQAVVDAQNADRQGLIDFLSYRTSEPSYMFPVSGSQEDFEEASEYGVPKGVRPAITYAELGLSFKWYDLAGRFTWMFLAEASREQVDQVQNIALEADNRLIFNRVMRTVFNATNGTTTRFTNGQGTALNVYKFYNADGMVPPTYKTNVHDNTHTHYLTSGAATVDPGDLHAIEDHLFHHGYSGDRGYQLVLMANRAEAEVIAGFKRGTASAKYDFIPAQGTPAFLLDEDLTIEGPRPPAKLGGLKVRGSYGPLLIVEEDYIPSGWVFGFATGGVDNLSNPVGIREHINPGLRGFRLVKGPQADYPLIDSYYQRGFGTGVRHRGAGVVMQITASGSYTAPSAYTGAF